MESFKISLKRQINYTRESTESMCNLAQLCPTQKYKILIDDEGEEDIKDGPVHME